VRFQPEDACSGHRIDPGFCPPAFFIGRVMDLAMVAPAQWHRKLIAQLAAQSSWTDPIGSQGWRYPD
jgi:hypothetical protein